MKRCIQNSEYIARVWKMNDERNRNSMLLPDGKTTYSEYCEERRKQGRVPLSYDSLFEPFDDCE